MKASDKVIIYDDSCPMCAAYTSAFVKTGLIKAENRQNFSTITPALAKLIDVQKSKNEIPVIELQTKKVYYGIDGLLEILSPKIPYVKKIVNAKPIRWVLNKLYKLISLNRRVIVAAKPIGNKFDCTPQFNIKYRLALVSVLLIMNTGVLFLLQNNVLPKSIFNNNTMQQVQLAHFYLVASNVVIACSINKKNAIEFLGQISMLATVTVLLFIPLIIANGYVKNGLNSINNLYSLLVTFFVVKDYVRRMKYINFFKNYKWVVAVNATCVILFITYLLY